MLVFESPRPRLAVRVGEESDDSRGWRHSKHSGQADHGQSGYKVCMSAALDSRRCQFIGLTDRGRVRANNEDAIAIVAELGLAVLADGMGGYNAGEVASAMAVDEVVRALRATLPRATSPDEQEQAIRASVARANQAILRAAATHPPYHGMGTTLVLARLDGGQVTIAHVGDSRAYRLRRGTLEPLTRDHSLVQEQVAAGRLAAERARDMPYRHLLTHALGAEPTARPDLSRHGIEPGDRYLLCSDGLHDMLDDAAITAELLHAASPRAGAQALLDAANAAGGQDNISIILVECGLRAQE